MRATRRTSFVSPATSAGHMMLSQFHLSRKRVSCSAFASLLYSLSPCNARKRLRTVYTVCVALTREVMNKDWLFWLVFLAFLAVGLIGMWVCQRRPTMVVHVLTLLLVALAGGTQMMTLNHIYADETISAGGSQVCR